MHARLLRSDLNPESSIRLPGRRTIILRSRSNLVTARSCSRERSGPTGERIARANCKRPVDTCPVKMSFFKKEDRRRSSTTPTIHSYCFSCVLYTFWRRSEPPVGLSRRWYNRVRVFRDGRCIFLVYNNLTDLLTEKILTSPSPAPGHTGCWVVGDR